LAVDALLRGAAIPSVGPEVTSLLRVAAGVGVLADPSFPAGFKKRLIREAQKKSAPASLSLIPQGVHAFTPHLHVPAEAKMMDFLKNVFGATEDFRVPTSTGTIMHGEVRIGDSVIELSEVPDDYVCPRATSLRTYVQSVDETYRRALDAGAVSLYEP